jgi:hypothetical protein
MISRLRNITWQLVAKSKTQVENCYNGKGYNPELWRETEDLWREHARLLRAIERRLNDE